MFHRDPRGGFCGGKESETPERKARKAQRVGRAQTARMENLPAKITKLIQQAKKRDSDQDATNHSVKVWNLNHEPVLGL